MPTAARWASPHAVTVGWWPRLALLVFTTVSLGSDLNDQYARATQGLHQPLDYAILVAGYVPLYLLLVDVEAAMACAVVGLAVCTVLGDPVRVLVTSLVTLAALSCVSTLRRTLIALALVVGCLAAWMVFEPSAVPGVVWFVIPVAVVAVGFGRSFRGSIRQRLQDERDLARLRQLHTRAKEQERRRLAHDLHDIVAHDVTIIAMQSGMAAHVADEQRLRQIIATIADASQQTLVDLRRLVRALNADDDADASGEIEADPTWGDAGTTASSIADDLHLVRGRLEGVGLTTTVAVDGDAELLPASLNGALSRSVRECATNVIKHAGPGNACAITLDVGRERVRLRVVNTLRGSQVDLDFPTSGYGLSSLVERARILGGTCRAGVSDGCWDVDVVIPLSDVTDAAGHGANTPGVGGQEVLGSA